MTDEIKQKAAQIKTLTEQLNVALKDFDELTGFRCIRDGSETRVCFEGNALYPFYGNLKDYISVKITETITL